MDQELILFGYLPALIAAVQSIHLLFVMVRARLQIILLILVAIALNIFSLFILIEMTLGAWPSYLPHILIVVSTFVYAFIVHKTRKDLNF